MATSDQAALAARLKKQSKVAYDTVKDVEATVGGKELPGGLRNAYGVITAASIAENKNGDAYFSVKANCVAPEEYRGALCRLPYFSLVGDQFNSEKENVEQLLMNLKLLGFKEEVEDADNHVDVLLAVSDYIADKKNPPLYFKFHTSNRPSKDGNYKAWIDGVDTDFDPNKAAPAAESENEGYESVGESPFSVGNRVVTHPTYFNDGTSYTGTVQSLNDGYAEVEFEDGSVDEIPFDQLELEQDSPEEESAPFEFQVGDTVDTTGDYFGDGQTYTGEIVSLDGTTAVVKFEDGEYDVEVENLVISDA